MKQKPVLSLFAAAALTALTVHGAVIVETETNGAATNNNVGTAQVIAGSAFTSPSPANVFTVPGASTTATIQGKGGDNDIDFYSFQNTFAGARLYIDVDNGTATFDNMVAVFSSSGTLLAWGDDTTPVDAGSQSFIDALLGPVVLSQLGTYFIAVTENPNFPAAALLFTESPLALGGVSVTGATVGLSSYDLGGTQPSTPFAYTLQATVVTPEPATSGIAGLALIGIAVMRRRKRLALGRYSRVAGNYALQEVLHKDFLECSI